MCKISEISIMKKKIKINVTSDRNSYLWKQAFATTASSMISLCSGMTIGITAVMLPQLREDKGFLYDPYYDSWIASIASIAMIAGSLSCSSILDAYGRKASHFILGGPFILGWVIIACANSTTLILVGRFLTGFTTGANKAVPMVYIGEIADPKIRTTALFLPGLTSHLGIIFSHIAGYYLAWKTSAMVCIVPAVISLIAFIFLKESPFWLIAKGRMEEGAAAFRWFRGTDEDSERELKSVLERQIEKEKISVNALLNNICQLSFIKPMLILLVLMLSVQFSGANVICFYSQDIFERLFHGKVDPFFLTIAMDFLRAIIAVLFCFFGKFFSKRKAFLASNFGVTLFVLGLVMSFYFVTSDDYMWVPIACLVIYISFSSAIISTGWTFVPELLPNNARGLGTGMNATFSYLSLFAIVKVTPDFMNFFGEPAMFAFYGISTLVCGSILCFLLPETNGKTLQSIEDDFSKKKVSPTEA